MLRRSTALVLTTAVTGALLTSAPATAVGETCQGRPATIVGTEYEVRGTAGDDVIVTGASGRTYAGAGNDLVCVRPSNPSLSGFWVDSGPGDDVVDASAAPPTGILGLTARLGTGVDRYVGGAGEDRVSADGADDHVSHADFATLRITARPVAGRTGTYDVDMIEVLSADRDVEVDLVARKVLVSGKPAADTVSTNHARAAAPYLTVRGNDENNYLSATGCDVHVFGNGGDDNLRTKLSGYPDDDPIRFTCELRATVRGGLGDDFLNGSKARDRLFGGAENDELVGRGGADLLVGGSGRDDLSGGRGPDVIRGNAGADTMTGEAGDDTLLGNRGRDNASGDAGRDRCVAERERRCER